MFAGALMVVGSIGVIGLASGDEFSMTIAAPVALRRYKGIQRSLTSPGRARAQTARRSVGCDRPRRNEGPAPLAPGLRSHNRDVGVRHRVLGGLRNQTIGSRCHDSRRAPL